MKLVFLATLDAILQRGSFGAAAEEMGLTPSAVSLQIKRLEEHFGQPLFVRSARVAQPTPAAYELARTMRDALSAMEALRVKTSTAVEGRVSVGTIRTVQTNMVPSTLKELRRRYPNLVVRAVQGESGALMQQLKTGALDAAVVIRPSSAGAGRLRWTRLAREPFVLIAPPDSVGTSITELLRRYDLVQFDTQLVSGRLAANYLRRIAPRVRGKVEVDSIETIFALVAAGYGISIVPKPRLSMSETHPVREIELGEGSLFREIAFVCRELDADNRRVRALLDTFTSIYGVASVASGDGPLSSAGSSAVELDS